MGRFDFQYDDALVNQLFRLGNVDQIATQILEETAPILERYIKAECRNHRRTGELEDSVNKSKSFKNARGYFITVRPTGYSKKYKTVNGRTGTRKEKVRNMEIMAHIEYGTSNQEATPVMTKGLKDAEPEVRAKMQEMYNRMVNGT